MGQFFYKKSGSQEDNQASILGCPHLFFGRRGRKALEFCYPASQSRKFKVFNCQNMAMKTKIVSFFFTSIAVY